MPGRAIMEQASAMGSQGLKRDRSQAQSDSQPSSQAPPVQASPATQANGSTFHDVPNGVLANGAPEASHLPPTTNGVSSTMDVSIAGPSSPPPLDQSWRQHPSNKSLGLMMERVAQQCYYELNQALTAMSEVPAEPQHHQTNGIVPISGPDTSDASLDKKRKLLEFASSQRDRFIKTLVLSDWCRNEEDQGKLIDVKVWQDKQRSAYYDAARAIGQTKLNMIPAKMPNPNIEGAMELLGTGSASWFPDLGYIPPKRLTAKQLLKTLRNMNVILATRLNLHEDLPPHFQDFSIADGRATFTVRDEFEVDLSLADEDPAEPFYFIDIRLLFTPSSCALNDRMRAFMENKVSQELATKGLKGCYDFLHNFVLTHKINILRSQATELIPGKWVDCIRVENMRRSVVVQYWAGMPGPKSWIEIGISSGKQKDFRLRRPVTSHISIRWFRKGVEVKDEKLEFDWRDLDLEKCLSMVIMKHTIWLMNNVQKRIQDSAPAGSPLAVECRASDPDSETPSLSLRLPSLRQALSVRLEPVTGQYSLSPPSPVSANIERRLNSDPKVDTATRLSELICACVQERVREESQLLDWTFTAGLVQQDNLQQVFGVVIRRFSVFSPGKYWGENWALAVTFSLSGEGWWVISLEEKRDEQGQAIGKVILNARQVRIPTKSDQTVSQDALGHIERLAVAEVAFSALSSQLKEMRVPHQLDTFNPPSDGSPPPGRNDGPVQAMFIRFSQLMKVPKSNSGKPWASELVRLTHHGTVAHHESTSGVRHDLRLTLEDGKFKQLHKHLTRFGDKDLALNDSGGLALKFLTPFGQPFGDQIRKRLESVERLDKYVAILKEQRYNCTHVGMSRICFSYDKTPELSAEVMFSSDGGLPACLKLLPPDSNPHLRVRALLVQVLNSTGNNGVEALAQILKVTLPVLQAFDRMESLNPGTLSVHPRASTTYLFKYRLPLPRCMFQVKARSRLEGDRKVVRWHVQEMRDPKVSGFSEDFVLALKELWRGQGEHWNGAGSGVSNGIIADAQGIDLALEKIDEVVRRFEGKGEITPVTSEGAEKTTSKLAKGQTQAQTQPPPAANPQSQPASQASNSTGAQQGNKPVKNEPDVILLD